MHILVVAYIDGPGTFETFYSTDPEALKQRMYRWYEENVMARDMELEENWKEAGWFKYHAWDAFQPTWEDGTPCEYQAVLTVGRPT